LDYLAAPLHDFASKELGQFAQLAAVLTLPHGVARHGPDNASRIIYFE